MFFTVLLLRKSYIKKVEMEFNEETKKWESPYWHPAVTTDAVVFGFDGEELNVLLIQRGLNPHIGKWALPGGFLIKSDETAMDGVRRELKEETNVDIFLEEFSTFSDKNRDERERVITIAFFALVKKNRFHIKGGDDAAAAKWYPVNDLPELAFDHDKIIAKAMETIRQRIHFEPIGFQLLEKEFTMTQLQNIYLAILNPDEEDNKIRDRRNFTKKMLNLGYIVDTGKVITGKPYKSPKLYTFDEQAYGNAKKLGIRLEF